MAKHTRLVVVKHEGSGPAKIVRVFRLTKEPKTTPTADLIIAGKMWMQLDDVWAYLVSSETPVGAAALRNLKDGDLLNERDFDITVALASKSTSDGAGRTAGQAVEEDTWTA